MTIDLSPDDTFAAIVRTINANLKELLFVEQIAVVWEFLLWNIVIAKLLRRYTLESNSVVTALASYCSALDLPIDGHFTPTASCKPRYRRSSTDRPQTE